MYARVKTHLENQLDDNIRAAVAKSNTDSVAAGGQKIDIGDVDIVTTKTPSGHAVEMTVKNTDGQTIISSGFEYQVKADGDVLILPARIDVTEGFKRSGLGSGFVEGREQAFTKFFDEIGMTGNKNVVILAEQNRAVSISGLPHPH